MAFWGTPLSALLFAPMALLEPRTALLVFKVQNALMLSLAAWLVFAFYEPRRDPDRLSFPTYGAVFVVLLLLFQPMWTVYRVGGQTTPTVLVLLIGSLILHVNGKAFAAALLFAFAVVIKPFLAPGFALLALTSGSRFFAYAAACGIGFAAMSIGIFGWPLHEQFLARAREGGMFMAIWGSGLILPLDSFILLLEETTGLPDLAVWRNLGVAAIKVVALAVTVRVLWAGRAIEPTQARRHLNFLCALVFALFVSSAVWEHYLAFLLPLVTLWVVRFVATGREPARLVTLLVCLLPAQSLILLLALRSLTPVPSAVDLIGSLVRAAPLWIIMWILWKYRAEVVSAFGEAEQFAESTTAQAPTYAQEAT